ncbi:multicopper oxidase domain-containing protein [Bradyrhizobium sp. USDA 4454]
MYNADGTCRPDIVSSEQQQLANQYCGMRHAFRDTIIVENNYQIRIRTRYESYIGEYALHCHILGHEDAGMMMVNIAIVPDLNAAGGGLECRACITPSQHARRGNASRMGRTERPSIPIQPPSPRGICRLDKSHEGRGKP